MELTHEYVDWSQHPSSSHQAADLQRERWRWLIKGRLQGASVALLAFVFWKIALIVGLTLFVLRALFWSGRRYWLRQHHHHAYAAASGLSHHDQGFSRHPQSGTSAQSSAQPYREPDPPENTLSELEAFDRRLRATTRSQSGA